MAGHRLHIAHRQAQFGRNLFIGKVQAHEVQAQYPYAQQTMMPFEDRPAQIVILLSERLTRVALLVRIPVMMFAFLNVVRVALRASNPIRPAQLAHHLVTLRIIN